MNQDHRPRFYVSGMALLICAAALGIAPAWAQSVWAPRLDQGSVQVEVLRPSFEGEIDLSLATSLWFVTGRFPTSENTILELDLPFSHLGVDEGSSSSSIGNPHIGLELRGLESGASLLFSTRLPLVDEDEPGAILLGSVGDISRWEAWAVDIVPLSLLGRYEKTGEQGFGVRLDAGPTIWFPTGDRDDTEFLALYAIQGVYADEDVRVGLGVHGRAILSDDDFEVGESTLHELGVTLGFRAGRAWPGLQIRLPIEDDLGDVVDYTVGLQVSVEIGHGSY